jgi:hypothetical protein
LANEHCFLDSRAALCLGGIYYYFFSSLVFLEHDSSFPALVYQEHGWSLSLRFCFFCFVYGLPARMNKADGLFLGVCFIPLVTLHATFSMYIPAIFAVAHTNFKLSAYFIFFFKTLLLQIS